MFFILSFSVCLSSLSVILSSSSLMLSHTLSEEVSCFSSSFLVSVLLILLFTVRSSSTSALTCVCSLFFSSFTVKSSSGAALLSGCSDFVKEIRSVLSASITAAHKNSFCGAVKPVFSSNMLNSAISYPSSDTAFTFTTSYSLASYMYSFCTVSVKMFSPSYILNSFTPSFSSSFIILSESSPWFNITYPPEVVSIFSFFIVTCGATVVSIISDGGSVISAAYIITGDMDVTAASIAERIFRFPPFGGSRLRIFYHSLLFCF